VKKLIAGVLIVVILFGVIACAAADEAPTHVANEDTNQGSDSVYGIPSKDGVTVPRATTPPTSSPQEPGDDYEYGNGESVTVDRMIIRTGDMYLVVEDVAVTMEQIAALAGTYQGWVVDSNVWQDGDRKVGNISIRVLAEYFDDTIRALRGMAVEVRQETTSGRDVTEEYVDLSARLSNLEASETQLLDLMEQAGTVAEILEVQRELTKTRSEIESIKGRMQYLEESSSTSFIRISLEQSKLAVEFFADTRNIKEGEYIQFTSEISGGFSPYTYEWDFGDGNTSTEANPRHSYKSDGDYSITLKVTDDRGGTADYDRVGYINVLRSWDVGRIAETAWNGLASFGKVLVNILIWLGIFSPVWIIIGLIIYLLVRRRRNKKTQ